MKLLIVVIFSINSIVFADCEFSSGIQKQDNGYLYTTECHKRVGLLVKNEKDMITQINLLNKNLELKDLTIEKETKRADMWMDTANNLNVKYDASIKNLESTKWVYFGVGILVMGLATYSASKLGR